MNNITNVPEVKTVLIEEQTWPRRTRMVHPGKTHDAYINSLIRTVTKSKKVLLDLFAGSFATAKAFMRLPKHW